MQSQGSQGQRQSERNVQCRRPQGGLCPNRVKQPSSRTDLRPWARHIEIAQEPSQQEGNEQGDSQWDENDQPEGNSPAKGSDREDLKKAGRADHSQPRSGLCEERPKADLSRPQTVVKVVGYRFASHDQRDRYEDEQSGNRG
jgi:hypothetical protein